MFCCRSRDSETWDLGPGTAVRSSSSVFRVPFLRDDRGVALLEGIIVFALLAGVLLGLVLLGQWGTHRQYAQMGARLLAFDAGTDSVFNDDSVVKFGRFGDSASRTFTSDSLSWAGYFDSLPVDWFNTFFVLWNDRYSASMSGVQRGREPGPGASLFDFSPRSLGYHSNASAATNSWADTAAVEPKFLGIAYWVGYNQATPEGLDFRPAVPDPPARIEVLLGTIYTRVGVQ